MPSEAPAKLDNPHDPHPLPLGYFQCRNRIALFKKFQHLIRHRERWGLDIKFAPPLETLIPKDTKHEDQRLAIEREINKLTMPVSVLLKQGGIQTVYVYRKEKPIYPFPLAAKEPEVEPIRFDIILQYFDIEKTGVSSRVNFEAIMRALDQGIGAYEFRKKTAFWEIFNPGMWIAHLIRLPIWILRRAGFAPSQGFYESFIKTLMLIIVAGAAVRLGLITSKDLTPHILKWLGI
jgi:hypothetical protein